MTELRKTKPGTPKFEISSCPEPGTKLLDKDGAEWVVTGDLTVRKPYMFSEIRWPLALDSYGPFTLKPEPDSEPEPRVWQIMIPEEPPVGTKVRDDDGDSWRREQEGDSGWYMFGGIANVGCTWADVLGYGPLTEVVEL